MANGIAVTILCTAAEDRATLGSDPSAAAVPYGMGGIQSVVPPFLMTLPLAESDKSNLGYVATFVLC